MENLYVHIPFCASKCRYCAFHSDTDVAADRIARYPRMAARELRLRSHSGGGALSTIYVGGGTPSMLGADGIRELFAALPKPAPGAEITVEVNPADVTPELAAALAECGVTRVSVGAQSFDDACLAFLGRRHTAAAADVAVSALRHAGVSAISIDLICAVPGFGEDVLLESVHGAIALGVEHISVYALSVERNTPLERDVAAGSVVPLEDDAAMDQLAVAESALRHGGYGRYEISNYALPGHECRHNMEVWRGRDYVGIGPAAASREGLVRRVNSPGLGEWWSAVEGDLLPPADIERLSVDEDERERFLTGLRLAEGRSVDAATELGLRRLEVFRRMEKVGVVERLATGAWALTSRGREVADAVMAEF